MTTKTEFIQAADGVVVTVNRHFEGNHGWVSAEVGASEELRVYVSDHRPMTPEQVQRIGTLFAAQVAETFNALAAGTKDESFG